jgi:hypothetical protein
MADYTKKGFKLEREELVFTCSSRWVVWTKEAGFQRGTDLISARLQVFAPCTQDALRRQVRAWLAAYEDEELVALAEQMVAEAIDAMAETPTGTPSLPPQKGQAN